MKKNLWFLGLISLSVALFAQPAPPATAPPAGTPPAEAPTVTNAPAATSAATNAPSGKAEKKKAKKKAETKAAKKAAVPELKSEPLVAGPAVVIASNVNVRGQAKLKSEVIGKLTKGQPVTVLEEVTLKKSAPDEPSAWAKILLPTNIHVWVHTSFINASNKTVVPRKLNVRSGPGENYSVLGLLKRGEPVKELSTKGDWVELEAPGDAYGFVAAQYLKQEPPGTTPTVVETPTVAATVPETPAIAAAPTDTPTTPPADTPAAATAATPEATPTVPETPAADQPLPKRIVQREGIVRGTFSIQAPTRFELANPENGRTMNYLYTTSTGLDLSRYKGLRIIVTGEEGLDDRWRNTPIITIQRIQVIE
jgi:uncharacterized protein YgiM (DUF1202 family)